MPHTTKKEKKGQKIRLQVSTAKKGKSSGIVSSENTPIKVFGMESSDLKKRTMINQTSAIQATPLSSDP